MNKKKTQASTIEGNINSEKNNQNLFGVKTIHGGSLVDYFKSKWADLKGSKKSLIDAKSEVETSGHYFEKGDENFSSNKFSESENEMKKEKSKKRKLSSPLNDLKSENEAFCENNDDYTKDCSKSLKKRKYKNDGNEVAKKKIKKNVDSNSADTNEIQQNIAESNQNMDSETCIEDKTCQDLIFNANDQISDKNLSKKKKKKKKREEKSDSEFDENLEKYSDENKKTKKEKKLKIKPEKTTCSNLVENIDVKAVQECSTYESKSSTEICNTDSRPVKKKKKDKEKDKKTCLPLSNLESTINSQVKSDEVEDFGSEIKESSKKKKKSKRDTEKEEIVENVSCITVEQGAEGIKQIGENLKKGKNTELNIESEERIEKKKKKKKDKLADVLSDKSDVNEKSKEEFHFKNKNYLDNAEDIAELEAQNSVEKKKKPKKDKKEKVAEDCESNREESNSDPSNAAEDECKVKKKKNKNKDKKKTKELDCEAVRESEVKPESAVMKDTNDIKTQTNVTNSRDDNTSAVIKKTANEVNNPSKSKTADSETNIIHTHKLSLFHKNKKEKINPLSNMSNSRVLKLYCGAQLENFRGSNLSDLKGYGMSLQRENVEALVKR